MLNIYLYLQYNLKRHSMKNTKQEMLDNLRLNENLYLYHKDRGFRLTKRGLTSLYKEILADKLNSKSLLDIKNVSENVDDKVFNYSILVFKYDNKPSFIDEVLDEWYETKLAYLLLIEYDEYMAISRRNISKLQELKKHISPIDSDILSSLFLAEDSKFEKFSLQNMNLSDSALRNKTLEAPDLSESFASNSSSSFILDSFRISNDDEEKVSISLNTAKINRLGIKQKVNDLSKSIVYLIDKLKITEKRISILTSFAEAISFEDYKEDLFPIAILLNFSRLYDDIEQGKISSVLDEDNEIDINHILIHFKPVLAIEDFNIQNDFTDDFTVKINTKSITLSSQRLKKIILSYNDGNPKNLIDYLNTYSSYIINFDNLELVYSGRKLFRDNKLLGNIDSLIQTFVAYPELATVTSEKGNFTSASTSFEARSIFGFVEKQFLNEFDYFICDDLGNEWADHIGLNNNSVSFYISKYDDTIFSATSFHDVIGQALKNLGHIFPLEHIVDDKENIWGNKYNINKINTNISRLRRGDSVANAIDFYKRIIKLPNIKKSIFLIINFISKSKLEESLNMLRNGEDFRERNQTIQILWFISTLISGCREVNTNIYICCKP